MHGSLHSLPRTPSCRSVYYLSTGETLHLPYCPAFSLAWTGLLPSPFSLNRIICLLGKNCRCLLHVTMWSGAQTGFDVTTIWMCRGAGRNAPWVLDIPEPIPEHTQIDPGDGGIFSFGTSVSGYKTTRRHILEYGDYEEWEEHEDVRGNAIRT
jgi:hypothetical protein